jgi:hypothetical protein
MNFLQAHAAVSLSLASVLWAVQLVIYPAFRFIHPELFLKWHYGYTGAISWIVAPLILLQTGGVAARLFLTGGADLLWQTETALTAAAWAVTAFISVPIHHRLQRNRCEVEMRRLVSSNWIRTFAWSGTALCSWIAASRA